MTSHQHILWRYMGLLLFSFQFHCLLSYSDVEEKDSESNSLQPSARLICRTNETFFYFFVLFLNKATGKKHIQSLQWTNLHVVRKHGASRRDFLGSVFYQGAVEEEEVAVGLVGWGGALLDVGVDLYGCCSVVASLI